MKIGFCVLVSMCMLFVPGMTYTKRHTCASTAPAISSCTQALLKLGRSQAAEEDCSKVGWGLGDWAGATFLHNGQLLAWLAPMLPSRTHVHAVHLAPVQVLQSEPQNVKALLRRATAREAHGDVDAAVQDLSAVLHLEPHNKEAAAALDRLRPPPAPQQ